MAVFKCKMCGGTLQFDQGASVGTCDSCGTTQTLPKGNDEAIISLFNRANYLRLMAEFDKAAEIYEKVIEEDGTNAEAHWGLVLCKYGIEYVEDPQTKRRVPTCHRAQYESVMTDPDYLAAIENAGAGQQSIYAGQAIEISNIQKGILAIVKTEQPFDVFICYKETDEHGQRTVDSALANDLYYQLTQEGLKVFFAAITLEDKLGQEYEPYIFAALNSAKVMLVLGTRPEYFQAVWVRNEWSRFLKLLSNDRSRLLIPCYRDMSAYDLPKEFAHLQAQDMAKIGFVNDLVRGIHKVMGFETAKPVKETVVVQTAAPQAVSIATLKKRGFLALEDGEWSKADGFFEEALNQDPEDAACYLGKLMVELQVNNREDLKTLDEPFDSRSNCKKASRFDQAVANELADSNRAIRERIETAKKQELYQSGLKKTEAARTEADFIEAADFFDGLSGFLDADEQARSCREQAETVRKNAIYDSALALMSSASVESNQDAIRLFESIAEWKDSRVKMDECSRNIEQIMSAAKTAEAVWNRETAFAIKKKKARNRNAAVAITASSTAVLIALILIYGVILPAIRNPKPVPLESAAVGDIVEFGSYEQDNDAENGKEPIRWIVLDQQDNALLLISRFALDCQPYHTEWVDVTWESCTLRKWMNNEFYQAAFSGKEKERIRTTEVVNDANVQYDTNGGSNTKDKVFLLSIEESKTYFKTEKDRRCAPTDYAKAQGVSTNKHYKTAGKPACWCWLRSPGLLSSSAAFSNYYGSVFSAGFVVNHDNSGVRPVVWVGLDADQSSQKSAS